MTKRANKKGKQVIDVKGQEDKKPDGVQVIPGNVGVIQIQLLASILAELRKMNGGPK